MTAKRGRTASPGKPRTSRGGRVTQPKRRAPITLSPREREIVSLIWETYSNQKIAEVLRIGVRTVETHRANAMKKLGVTNTAQLIRAALKAKLVHGGPG